MKKYILNLKAIALFIFMALSFIACSDDDDGGSSFLEKNGGTVWKFEEPVLGGAIYAQINNSESNPFEAWQSLFEDTCFVYINFANEGDVEVVENSENKLVLRVDESSTEYFLLTLTVSGDTLTVKTEEFEDGSEVDEDIIILEETSDNPDDLEECEFEL